MRKLLNYFLSSLFFIFVVQAAQGAKFKGHTKVQGTKAMQFDEQVERFIETKNEFLILFSHHPAFYSFPKSKNSALEFMDFLETRITSQKKLLVTFDPKTVKILSLEDSK